MKLIWRRRLTARSVTKWLRFTGIAALTCVRDALKQSSNVCPTLWSPETRVGQCGLLAFLWVSQSDYLLRKASEDADIEEQRVEEGRGRGVRWEPQVGSGDRALRSLTWAYFSAVGHPWCWQRFRLHLISFFPNQMTCDMCRDAAARPGSHVQRPFRAVL